MFFIVIVVLFIIHTIVTPNQAGNDIAKIQGRLVNLMHCHHKAFHLVLALYTQTFTLQYVNVSQAI